MTDPDRLAHNGRAPVAAPPRPLPAPFPLPRRLPPSLPPSLPLGMPRQTVAGMTLDAIRARILRGVYPEGEPLRQDSLADELGVSRIPVREALRQLEAEGLVTVTPHRGAIVTTLSAAEVEEVFALRAEVESALLRAAIPRLGPDGLALAAELLERHERALADGDAVGGGSLSWEFRAALYAAADRPVTMSIVQRLHQQSERCFVRMQLAAGAAGAAGVRRAGGEEARRALLAAVARKDGRRACALLRGELLREGRALVAFLRRA